MESPIIFISFTSFTSVTSSTVGNSFLLVGNSQAKVLKAAKERLASGGFRVRALNEDSWSVSFADKEVRRQNQGHAVGKLTLGEATLIH